MTRFERLVDTLSGLVSPYYTEEQVSSWLESEYGKEDEGIKDLEEQMLVEDIAKYFKEANQKTFKMEFTITVYKEVEIQAGNATEAEILAREALALKETGSMTSIEIANEDLPGDLFADDWELNDIKKHDPTTGEINMDSIIDDILG